MKDNNKKQKYTDLIKGLHLAWEELRKHPHKETAGSDGETILSYSSGYSLRILELSRKLSENTFKFKPLKRATVEKGREILIQTVEERIVSKAILNIIGPILEGINSNQDFSRPVKYVFNGVEPDFNGIPLAVKVIQRSLEDGLVWVFEADIKGFFDHVPKEKILHILRDKIKDSKIFGLIREVLYFETEDKGDKLYDKTEGIAQGSPLSPIFASIYLYTFDMFVTKQFPDVKLVRYVDDFIVLCDSKEKAEEVYKASAKKLIEMGLSMYALNEKKQGTNIEKTKITCAKGYNAGPFNFLGLSFNYTDVDITSKKKDEINLKIKEIIHTGSENFLVKIRRIESRLNAYIDHYKKPHYKRTVASLNKIIKFAQDELRSYYIATYKKIVHKDPFDKLSDSTVESLFRFMGIDFEHILKKINRVYISKPRRHKK